MTTMSSPCPPQVLSTKVEVKLCKAKGLRWAALEGDGSAPLPDGPVPVKTPYARYRGPSPSHLPSASGRDWNKTDKELGAEAAAEAKADGERSAVQCTTVHFSAVQCTSLHCRLRNGRGTNLDG